MKWFLYFISFAWIATGSCFILYTGESREVLKKMYVNIPREVLIVITIGFGILFLMSAPHSLNSWVIVAFGILAIIKGVFFFLNPGNMFEKIRDWYLYTATEQTYRFFGIIMLLLGTAVFSWT
jgi:uncharacterized protein YjeT (DUF2065 family)